MRFIIYITTLLAFVWSCYWFIMSNTYSDKVYLWSNIGSADVSANLSNIRGFPNRFDTTISNVLNVSAFGRQPGWDEHHPPVYYVLNKNPSLVALGKKHSVLF